TLLVFLEGSREANPPLPASAKGDGGNTPKSSFARAGIGISCRLPNGYTKGGRGGVWLSGVSEQRCNSSWCERLYDEKAAHLLLYGRALGLSFSEAEDVVQEAFAALLELPEAPEQPENYAFRAVR